MVWLVWVIQVMQRCRCLSWETRTDNVMIDHFQVVFHQRRAVSYFRHQLAQPLGWWSQPVRWSSTATENDVSNKNSPHLLWWWSTDLWCCAAHHSMVCCKLKRFFFPRLSKKWEVYESMAGHAFVILGVLRPLSTLLLSWRQVRLHMVSTLQ